MSEGGKYHMEEYRVIYKILKHLEKSLDFEEPDHTPIEAESLKITEPKWARLMKMLVDDGYIKGVLVANYPEMSYPLVKLVNPTITLKGIEYLKENSLMKKASDLAKGIAEII